MSNRDILDFPLFDTQPITCPHCRQDCKGLPGGRCNCPASQAPSNQPTTPPVTVIPDFPMFDTQPITCPHCGQDCKGLPDGRCDCPLAGTVSR